MKKYFVYELKKSLFVMCALAVIATAVYVISVLTQMQNIDNFGLHYLTLSWIVACGGAMSVFVPIWKLRYLMKKRSVDLYYAMPLSHARILAVKFLVGLIVLFSSFTAAFWIGSFTAMGALSKYINCAIFVPFYFSMLIPMAVIYALTSFIFTRAKRLIDGIMFVIMTGMSLGIFADNIPTFVRLCGGDIYQYGFGASCFTPFGALSIIVIYVDCNILKSLSGMPVVSAFDWVGMSLVAVLGIAAGIGLFFAERRAKAEDCEQISESYFGYKVMIPLYAFSLALQSARISLVLTALIAAAAYAVSVLYKRTPKIGWIFAVIVGVAFIVGAVLGFCASSENIFNYF